MTVTMTESTTTAKKTKKKKTKKDLLLLYYYGLDDVDMGYAVRAQSSPGKPSGAVTAVVVERLTETMLGGDW